MEPSKNGLQVYHPAEVQPPVEVAGTVLPGSIRYLGKVAADGESARFAMTGMLLEVDGEEYSCVVTDGRCLLAARGSNTVGHGKGTILLPFGKMRDGQPTLNDALQGMRDDGSLKVQFPVGGNTANLYGTNYKLMTIRAVDGRFPDWRNVMPKGQPRMVFRINPFYLRDLLTSILPFFPKDVEHHRMSICCFEQGSPLALVAQTPTVSIDALIMPLS